MMHLKLKEYFEKRGLSQTEIADMLNVSPPYVNAILNGKKPIGKKLADRLNLLFGLSKLFLLTGEGDIIQQNALSTHIDTETEALNNRRGMAAEDDPAPYLPPWADSLIQILATQIKENEALSRELRQSISKVNSLRADLQHLLQNLPK